MSVSTVAEGLCNDVALGGPIWIGVEGLIEGWRTRKGGMALVQGQILWDIVLWAGGLQSMVTSTCSLGGWDIN